MQGSGLTACEAGADCRPLLC